MLGPTLSGLDVLAVAMLVIVAPAASATACAVNSFCLDCSCAIFLLCLTVFLKCVFQFTYIRLPFVVIFLPETAYFEPAFSASGFLLRLPILSLPSIVCFNLPL